MTAEVENNKHHTDETKCLRYVVKDILRPPVSEFHRLVSLVDFIDFMTPVMKLTQFQLLPVS